jgi:hypothetical protein
LSSLTANITLLDSSSYVVILPVDSSILQLPVSSHSLAEVQHSGLQDKPTSVIILGSNLPSLEQLQSASADGWLSGVSSDSSLAVVPRVGPELTLDSLPMVHVVFEATGEWTGTACAPPSVLCADARTFQTSSGTYAVACNLPAFIPVGNYSVFVFLAGQRVSSSGLPGVALGCSSGFFGRTSESCASCSGLFSSGSVKCKGGEAYPLAMPGWHAVNGSASVATCPGRRSLTTQRRLCVLSCACMGANRCGTGYVDGPPAWRCSMCAPSYYRTTVLLPVIVPGARKDRWSCLCYTVPLCSLSAPAFCSHRS